MHQTNSSAPTDAVPKSPFDGFNPLGPQSSNTWLPPPLYTLIGVMFFLIFVVTSIRHFLHCICQRRDSATSANNDTHELHNVVVNQISDYSLAAFISTVSHSDSFLSSQQAEADPLTVTQTTHSPTRLTDSSSASNRPSPINNAPPPPPPPPPSTPHRATTVTTRVNNSSAAPSSVTPHRPDSTGPPHGTDTMPSQSHQDEGRTIPQLDNMTGMLQHAMEVNANSGWMDQFFS